MKKKRIIKNFVTQVRKAKKFFTKQQAELIKKMEIPSKEYQAALIKDGYSKEEAIALTKQYTNQLRIDYEALLNKVSQVFTEFPVR